MPKASGEVLKFHGQLKGVSGETATATLEAKVDETGFHQFAAKMTEAKLRAAKPIVQEAHLRYDAGAFSKLRQEAFLTRKALSGIGGGGGIGAAIGGALTPFGKIGTLAFAASGPLLSVAGGLTAVAGSAAAAGAGLGALGIGAGGLGTVGIAGITAVAIPAVASLKALTKAQKSYTEAVETYGVQSTQAETAAKKLRAAERSGGKEAVAVVRTLDTVKERWASLTKPGRQAFLGALSDGLSRVEKKLPLLGRSANRSTETARKGFGAFLKQVTGGDFDRFVRTMTRTETRVVPKLSHAFGDWGQIMERVSAAAAPSLERVVGVFSKWSNHVLGLTSDARTLRQDVAGLTTQFLGWVHLLTAAGSLLTSIFTAGGAEAGLGLVEALTHQFRQWGDWIDSHRQAVAGFFEHTAEGTKDLASILGQTAQSWFLMAQAMEPVETLILKILNGLNKVHVFGQSMLTYLLGGFALLKGAIAAVKIKDLFEGFRDLRALTAATTTATEAETVALGAQAEAAGAAAAANADLAASNEAVAATSRTGAMGLAGKLGKAAGFAGAGFIGGQVAGSLVGGKAGGILSAAGTGAGIGAGIGTFFPEFGGPVTGAAVGAGVGAAVQGLQDLLAHEKQLSPLQQRLAAESKHVADALRNQRDAAHGLARAHSNLHTAEERQKAASNEVHRAEARLSADRHRYGADSNRVRKDELLLAEAKHRNAKATKEVNEAHRLSGASLKLYNHLTVVAAGSTKLHIADLKSEFQAQYRKFKQDESNNAAAKKAQHTLSKLNAEQRHLSQLYAEAGQKSGPRLQSTIEHLSATTSQFGTHLHGLVRQLPEFGQMSRHYVAGVGGKAWLDLRGTVHTSSSNVATDIKSMAQTSKIQIVGLDTKTKEILHSMMVGKVKFTAGGKGGPQKRQSGGFIVPGTGSGDSFHTTLLPNSFILNRNATAAEGFQRGGIPVALEPGERVFMPHEVAKIGAGNLHAANSRVPRFQKGGMLGAEPQLSGPSGSLRSIGQAAIHDVYQGAKEYIAAHKPTTGLVAGGGSVEAQIANVLFGSGFNKIGAAGVIGNAYGESANDPSAEGTGGGGLFGFTAGAISLTNLKAAAGRAGTPWDNVAFQVGFMLRHGGLGLRGSLNAAKTPEEAAVTFMNEWERPGIPRQDVREAGARRAYQHGYQQGGAITGTHSVGKRPKWAGWTAGGRWNPAAAQHFITGGEALEIPTHIKPSNSSPSSATPTAAVRWAMRHLGSSDQWGYPGEWCGAFLGADMQAIGLTPPSGYPSATNWSGYGSPLGKSHIQAGAILDYGSAHVAMAISSSEQIQGNNHEGVVGTSDIGGKIGGSGLTSVRWPPYSSGPGAGSAPKEKVPAIFHGARTAKLSLSGAVPKTLHGIQKEIHRREGELKVYRRAAAAASGMPATQQALQANVTALETRLSQLRKAASKERRKVAQKRFTRRLGRNLGKVTGFGKLIEEKQRTYQEKSEFAEQVVGLEPTEPILVANVTEAQRAEAEKTYVSSLAAYINGKETPAYANVLASENDWRDTILSGEGAATRFETGAEGHVHKLSDHIQKINDFTKKVAEDEAAYRKEHPKTDFPEWIKKEEKKRDELRARLPMLRYKEQGWRNVLGEARGEFYGGVSAGVEPVHPPMPPLAGTGAFEQSLIEVQGVHWPGMHEHLAALPPSRQAGSFGGAIWETQSSIEELGLRLRQAQAGIEGGAAGGEAGGKSEREELLEGLLRDANQRAAIKAALEPTLSQFEATYPVSYMGAFAKGGVAMVGERGPELAHLPSGTRIHSNTDTERMLGGQEVHVTVNGGINQEPGDRRQPIEVWLRDPRNQKLVRQVVGTTPRGVATNGMARLGRG